MFLAARPPSRPEGPGAVRDAPADAARASAVIVGAPYDGSSSFRRGARHGPAAIRWASQSIESYSPTLGRDLEALTVIDRGDLDLEASAPEAMIAAVAAAVGEAASLAPAVGEGAASPLPVLLGGDHSVTAGAVTALAARHPGLRVLILDAHLDLREEYEGSRWSHAAVTRRVVETVGQDRTAVLGVRAGTRREYADAAGLLAAQPRLTLMPELWRALVGVPLYLSVDLDVADPAAAPGVGNPEPGGATSGELLDLLRVLAPLSVVGVDVVELSPPFDPSGRTAVLAATLVREAILTWGR